MTTTNTNDCDRCTVRGCQDCVKVTNQKSYHPEMIWNATEKKFEKKQVESPECRQCVLCIEIRQIYTWCDECEEGWNLIGQTCGCKTLDNNNDDDEKEGGDCNEFDEKQGGDY